MAHSSSSQEIPPGAVKLCKDLEKLINNPQGSDVQFKVGGGTSSLRENDQDTCSETEAETIYAHSLILRCRSQYFDKMLTEDTNWKEHSNSVIPQPNISPSTFEDVLHYIYTGNIRAKSSKNIVELIIAADEMDLEELGAACREEFISIIGRIFTSRVSDGSEQDIPIDRAIHTHIIPVLNLARSKSPSLSHLSQKLQKIMLPRISVITKSPTIYTAFINGISSESLPEIIMSDNFSMMEQDVWDLALGWACHQTKISKTAAEDYIKNFEDEVENSLEIPVSSDGSRISKAQLDQLKEKMKDLLPHIRFSLLNSRYYDRIYNVMNYFLPRSRFSDINRFYLNYHNTEMLDKPRYFDQKILSTLGIKYTLWRSLRENIEAAGITGGVGLKFTHLFRASKHNFRASIFHQKCDNKGPTLILLSSADKHLFGGVNFDHWKSDDTWSSSPLNFLFVIPDGIHRKDFAVFKIKDQAKVGFSSYNSPTNGPIFGEHDLCIVDSANYDESSSNLSKVYTGSGASDTTLAGSKSFTLSDYEVFAISTE